MSLPEHLGGHKERTHIDEGSLKHVMRMFNIKTMLDIGCGPAGQVALARELGIEAYGIDGDYEVQRPKEVSDYITIHDYEKGPSNFDKEVDLIWSVEFVEHVWEKYQENYMKDFQRGKIVVMTYAPPGKAGHHHVNCNTEDYWKDVFKKYGFSYDSNMTRMIREISTMGTRKNIAKPGKPDKWKRRHTFVQDNGLCFVKL